MKSVTAWLYFLTSALAVSTAVLSILTLGTDISPVTNQIGLPSLGNPPRPFNGWSGSPMLGIKLCTAMPATLLATRAPVSLSARTL